MVVFAVSRVRLDKDGRVTHVLWGRVSTKTNAWAGPESEVPVKQVVSAIHAGHRVFALFPTEHGHVPERRLRRRLRQRLGDRFIGGAVDPRA